MTSCRKGCQFLLLPHYMVLVSPRCFLTVHRCQNGMWTPRDRAVTPTTASPHAASGHIHTIAGQKANASGPSSFWGCQCQRALPTEVAPPRVLERNHVSLNRGQQPHSRNQQQTEELTYAVVCPTVALTTRLAELLHCLQRQQIMCVIGQFHFEFVIFKISPLFYSFLFAGRSCVTLSYYFNHVSVLSLISLGLSSLSSSFIKVFIFLCPYPHLCCLRLVMCSVQTVMNYI